MDDKPQESTAELVAHLRNEDSRAGDLLDRLYRQPMIRFCSGYLRRMDEVEDAVQDVFCNVLAAQCVPDHFRPWIYTIARNRCLNTLRDRSRRKSPQGLPPDSVLLLQQTGFLTKMLKREQRDRLAELLESLPAPQREALNLRYNEGLSRAEIAAVLEIPEKTVKSRLFEGLRKLRKHASLIANR
jgi:RNA polymerase sigma-70 factor (ECF subfamily)